jgi:prepilin-type N-terminal cleavage/methylation domain-containing protein
MESMVKRGGKGFTLIEIIIVLAVLGVLAAVVVPNVAGFVTRGKDRSFEADRRLLQSAVDAWRTDVSNRAGNPWPTLTGNKGSIATCADDAADGIDVGTINANCHIVKISNLTPNYLKGADALKSFAYSTGTAAGATNSPVGSYVWYIDTNGLVQARRWTPASSSDTTVAIAEVAGTDGMVADVYP